MTMCNVPRNNDNEDRSKMKLSGLLVLCLVFYTCLAREEDILKFTYSDFESRISEYETALVMFYTPWCDNCKKLKPEYAKAADDLVRNDPPIVLVKVDCTEAGKETCDKHGVSTYPTLQIFRNGEFSQEYNGPREASGIVKYMKAQVTPTSKELVSFEQFRNFLKVENNIPVDLYCWNPVDDMHGSIEPTGAPEILWKNCILSCSINFTTVDAAVLEKLKTGFKKLKVSESKSLSKKYLTKEVFDNLKAQKTSFGSTLFDIIQTDLENIDSCIGIYAPDAEAYTVFVDLFEPVIEDYHGDFKKADTHFPSSYGHISVFGNLDSANEYVVSSRRDRDHSIEGHLSNPCSTKKLAAYTCRFRLNNDTNNTFPEWCKKEDHLRVNPMRMGNDLGQVYRRLVTAVNEIENSISFSRDESLRVDFVCRRQHINN